MPIPTPSDGDSVPLVTAPPPPIGLPWRAIPGPSISKAISFSAGDVLEFVLTVWLAYVISAFLRFVLQEDVYPRTQMTRGISYAVSSLLNYALLTLGFLAGVAVLGLDLTKVTIVAASCAGASPSTSGRKWKNT